MKSHWKPSDTKLNRRYLTLVHVITGELTISCRYGEIWPFNATSYKAYCHSAKICTKLQKYLAPNYVKKYKKGDEGVWVFGAEGLGEVAKILGYKHNRKSQIRFMETRND